MLYELQRWNLEHLLVLLYVVSIVDLVVAVPNGLVLLNNIVHECIVSIVVREQVFFEQVLVC